MSPGGVSGATKTWGPDESGVDGSSRWHAPQVVTMSRELMVCIVPGHTISDIDPIESGPVHLLDRYADVYACL
jgi:hypothetical protein